MMDIELDKLKVPNTIEVNLDGDKTIDNGFENVHIVQGQESVDEAIKSWAEPKGCKGCVQYENKVCYYCGDGTKRCQYYVRNMPL